jgi:hypothetical protein
MMNPSAFGQTVHMVLAAYAATGFAVAGIHAYLLQRDKQNLFHRHALAIALTVGGVAAILQPMSGDILGQTLAKNQPVKLAAMEGHFKTEKGAPMLIGGWPDEDAKETRYAIKIPYLLSLIAFHDPNATVKGLEAFPRDEWPPVKIIHYSFQIMVGALDHQWRNANRRSRHANARTGCAVRFLHAALCCAGYSGCLAVKATGGGQPASLRRSSRASDDEQAKQGGRLCFRLKSGWLER